MGRAKEAGAIRAGKLRQGVFWAALLIATCPGAALAEGRVALVVGNAAYSNTVGPLANPVKDATLIADALAARQFAVTRVVNLDRVQLLAAIDAYARRLAAAGPNAVGFVYYSGHGAANPDNGRNYLIPVDAQSAADSTLWYQSVPLQEIVDTISKIAPQAANVVVFDACREALRLPGGKGLGDGGKGLHREIARPSVLIAFSTAPDAIAADLDRSAATGPYATELAAALAKPGVDLETMFTDVKYGVLGRTGDKQLPYIENGLRVRVVLSGNGAPAVAGVDPYARWGLTERDFSVSLAEKLLDRAGAGLRLEAITRAAEAGDAVAQTLVGLVYSNGYKVPKDDAVAAQWFAKAAAAGNPRAMNALGVGYRDAMGMPKDYSLAMSWLRKSAAQGNLLATFNVGDLYQLGQGVPQDYAEALRWYRKAADLGAPIAMSGIGYAYANGLGVLKDYAEAMRWYRKSAGLEYPNAMINVGSIYRDGLGVPQDYAEAMRWYRKAADLNEPNAMTNIGIMYGLGQGVKQDYTEALGWYRKAAELGDATGMSGIGALYLHGLAVTLNYDEAMLWFRKAADLGDSFSMMSIGYMYYAGKGVGQDYGEALRWSRKAADLGEPMATKNLGDLFYNGKGVAKDFGEAMRWYRKAADLNVPAAMTNIGYLYKEGLGVPQDYAEARRWFEKAAVLGEGTAKTYLAELKAVSGAGTDR